MASFIKVRMNADALLNLINGFSHISVQPSDLMLDVISTSTHWICIIAEYTLFTIDQESTKASHCTNKIKFDSTLPHRASNVFFLSHVALQIS